MQGDNYEASEAVVMDPEQFAAHHKFDENTVVDTENPENNTNTKHKSK